MELETKRFERQIQRKIQSLEKSKKELLLRVSGLEEQLALCQKTLAAVEDLKSQARLLADLEGGPNEELDAADEEEPGEKIHQAVDPGDDLGIWVDSPESAPVKVAAEDSDVHPVEETDSRPMTGEGEEPGEAVPPREYAIPSFLRQYM